MVIARMSQETMIHRRSLSVVTAQNGNDKGFSLIGASSFLRQQGSIGILIQEPGVLGTLDPLRFELGLIGSLFLANGVCPCRRKDRETTALLNGAPDESKRMVVSGMDFYVVLGQTKTASPYADFTEIVVGAIKENVSKQDGLVARGVIRVDQNFIKVAYLLQPLTMMDVIIEVLESFLLSPIGNEIMGIKRVANLLDELQVCVFNLFVNNCTSIDSQHSHHSVFDTHVEITPL